MPSALFKINGQTAGIAQDIAAGSTVSLQLNDIRGVNTVSWEIFGTSENVSTPTITKSGIPSGITASFVVENKDNAAYGIKCIVNGGINAAGIEDENLTATSAVYVLSTSNVRPFFIGETYESDNVYGWIDRLNAIVKDVGSGIDIGDPKSCYYSNGSINYWNSNPEFSNVLSDGYVAATSFITSNNYISSPYYKLGINPASSGGLRIANNSNITYRNAENSADIVAITVDGYNSVNIRDSALTLSSTQANFYSNGCRLGNSYISVGATPAADGYIRLPNNTSISFRNAANSADINAIGVDSSNNINIAAPLYVTYENSRIIARSATDNTGYACLFFGAANISPSSTNYSIKSNGATQFYNTSTVHDFRIGASSKAQISSTYMYLYLPALNFTNTQSNPTISQLDFSTAGGTGQSLNLQSQNSIGTGSTVGGALNLKSGTGATAGSVNIYTGAQNRITVAPKVTTITDSTNVNMMSWLQDSLTTYFCEDFYNATNVNGYAGGMQGVVSGTAAAINQGSGYWGNSGTAALYTGSTNTGSATIRTSLAGIRLGLGETILRTWVLLPELSSSDDTFTFTFGFAGSGTSALKFSYTHGTNSGKWVITSDNGTNSNATSTNTTVTYRVYHKLEIYVNAAGSSVSYYIDGVLAATHTQYILTTANMGIYCNITKSAGTTAREAYIDAIQFGQRHTR